MVQLVVVVAVSDQRFVLVVRSLAKQAQPFVAVSEFPIVIVTVQVPVVPEVNLPAVAPPTSVLFEHPLAVNVVPPDWKYEAFIPPFEPAVLPVALTSTKPAEARQRPVSSPEQAELVHH